MLSRSDLLDAKGRVVLMTDVWSHQLGAHGGGAFANAQSDGSQVLRPWREFILSRTTSRTSSGWGRPRSPGVRSPRGSRRRVTTATRPRVERLAVAVGLQIEEPRVATRFGNERLVRTLFDHASMFEHDDLIGHAHRRKAVRDHDTHPVLREASETVPRNTSDSASASIAAVGSSRTKMSASSRMKARDNAIFCHCPTDSSWPFLNHLPSCVGVYLGRQFLDERVGHAHVSGALPSRLSGLQERVHVARTDILADEELIPDEVLEDDADAPAKRVGAIPFAQVEPDRARMRPFGRFVEARQQLDQRGLPRAVLADQGELAAARNVQRDVTQRRGAVAASAIGETKRRSKRIPSSGLGPTIALPLGDGGPDVLQVLRTGSERYRLSSYMPPTEALKIADSADCPSLEDFRAGTWSCRRA